MPDRPTIVLVHGAWYGSLQLLADQGVGALQACAFVEPAG
jgi:hypothetical protein